jgi:hypothetical protein
VEALVSAQSVRTGTRKVLGGGTKVTFIDAAPGTEAWEPDTAAQPLSEDGLTKANLLRERIFDMREMAIQPVLSKETVVREELVVRRSVERHVEHIEESVRRTEAAVEEIAPPAPGASADRNAPV